MAEWSKAQCLRHGRSRVRAPNLHQCLRTRLQVCWSKRLGCHADLYTVSRCRSRGESQEYIARRRQCMHARDPPWLWNSGETSPEVRNSISGPTKRTYVLQKFKRKHATLNCWKTIHIRILLCLSWNYVTQYWVYRWLLKEDVEAWIS